MTRLGRRPLYIDKQTGRPCEIIRTIPETFQVVIQFADTLGAILVFQDEIEPVRDRQRSAV